MGDLTVEDCCGKPTVGASFARDRGDRDRERDLYQDFLSPSLSIQLTGYYPFS